MSTISKKVLRRKIKILKVKLGETLRKRLEKSFVGQPVSSFEVTGSRLDEEKGIYYVDVLVKPVMNFIDLKIVIGKDEVTFVND